MPKRNHKVLPLNETVNIPDLRKEKKKSYAEVAKVCGKGKSHICEIVKKEEEICAIFSLIPHTAKVMTTL